MCARYPRHTSSGTRVTNSCEPQGCWESNPRLVEEHCAIPQAPPSLLKPVLILHTLGVNKLCFQLMVLETGNSNPILCQSFAS